MLNPLSDKAAEILGVEKRTYLVFGISLYDIMKENNCGKYDWYSCYVRNSKTLRCIDGDMDDYEKITVKGVDLYKGKLVKKPLPIPKPSDEIDLYLELFEGDIVWNS